MMSWLIFFTFLLYFRKISTMDCSKSECLRVADPLVREARFIFPDNMADIQLGCRTWDDFVNCLKQYTERCFNEEDRRRFNNAVESPIENIHELCMNVKYQNEYLKYAPCIKNTITERSHCGSQYQMLVDQVSQKGNGISRSSLCCSHDRFKQCVQRETRRQCDAGSQNGQASVFSMQLLDKALRFIEEQCVNYIPNSGDCNHVLQDSLPSTDVLSMSTVSSEVYPWSTLQDSNSNIIKEARNPVYRGSTSNIAPTYSWSSSPSLSTVVDLLPPSSSSITPVSMSEVLGSRKRPASYGRANSWSESQGFTSNPSPSDGIFQGYPNNNNNNNEISSKPYWATTSATPSWKVMKKEVSELGGTANKGQIHRSMNPENYQTTIETTHWYPAAGSHLSNDVEEPNQQGLTIPRNDSNFLSYSFHSIFLVMLLKILI